MKVELKDSKESPIPNWGNAGKICFSAFFVKISFVRVNKSSGEVEDDSNGDFYFELFLEENIN